MSHLQFYRAILSHNFIAQHSCSMQLCMSHTATVSHKQELTNQHWPHSDDKVAQNRALLCSEKDLCNCSKVARHARSQLRFCCTIKLHNKVAWQNCKCDIGLNIVASHSGLSMRNVSSVQFCNDRSKLLWHTKTQILATDISKQHEILHRFQVLIYNLIRSTLLIQMLMCCTVF